jgi:hypothetical protein
MSKPELGITYSQSDDLLLECLFERHRAVHLVGPSSIASLHIRHLRRDAVLPQTHNWDPSDLDVT